ncbi:MAG: DnaD domain protein [Ruminococcus sp.]|nr:DnaD domain protein [Ruminococcus sp.]
MTYKIDISSWGRFFTVPCAVADKYIKLADGDYVKVLLCILAGSSSTVDSKALSDASGVNEAKVCDAVLYWSQNGVISVNGQAQPAPAEAVPAAAPVRTEAPADAAPAPKTVASVRLSPRDLADRIESSPELKYLVSEFEKIKGSDIKHHEIMGLINLTEYYGFDAESLLLIITYCHELGKTSISYIERVGKDWAERGINEYSEVEAEIVKQSRQRSFEHKVCRAFGIETKLSPKQSEYIRSWQELGMSVELLTIAYDKCMDAINKLDFRYIDKIVRGWADRRLTTPDQIAAEDKARYESYQKKHGSDKSETSYDIDRWEEFAMNYDPNYRGVKPE